MLRGEIGWLQDILGTCPADTTISYLGRPSTEDLRFLLPTRPAAVAGASLRRSHNGRSMTEGLAAVAGRAAGRVGLIHLAPGQRLALPQFELVDHLARVLGEPSLLAAVTLGRRRRNRKPVLQLIRPDGRTVGFAKVGWSPLTAELVAGEVEILRCLEGRLPAALAAPVVIHHERWRDREVAVTTPLRTPWLQRRRGFPAAELIRSIAAVGGDGRCPVPDLAVLDEWRRAGLGEVINLDRIVERHQEVSLRIGLWHGDLTPWNTASLARSVAVWDWEFAGHGRPIGFDGLHRCFEQHRRRPNGSNQRSLSTVIARTAQILEPLGLALTGAERAAMVDLYLCELISRELRLSGQRWSAGELAGLGPVALAALDRRVATVTGSTTTAGNGIGTGAGAANRVHPG
jgi:hypothetical protein